MRVSQVRNTIYGVYDRLRRRRILDDKLTALEGTRFHIPVLNTKAEQQLRQHPDYEDRLIAFYSDPEPNDTDLKQEDIVYNITDVTVHEDGGIKYRINRILDRTTFDAQIIIALEFSEPRPTALQRVPEFPFFDTDEARFYRELDDDRWVFVHDWEGVKSVDQALAMLNQSMAAVWNTPQTIEEAWQRVEAWNQFNQTKERWR